MGRTIAVGPAGNRHMIYHELNTGVQPCFPYSIDCPRYVSYNCKDPLDNWLGRAFIDGGFEVNAGYANIMVMHDGREVVLYHSTAETPEQHSKLAVGDEGQICSGSFVNIYDLPDIIDGAISGAPNGYWPKGCVVYDAEVDTDYIHILVNENNPDAGGDQTLGYERCVFRGDTLVCRSPGGLGPYRRLPNLAYPGALDVIAVIDTIKTISAVAVSSPVSEKIAIVYTKNREDISKNNDVMYVESTNNGEDWLDGTQWPPIKYNVTNYDPLWPERAYVDVAACYDYNDNLHIVWSSCYWDSVAQDANNDANLMHWTDTSPLGFDNATMVASGYWDDGTVGPGAWCRIISKMSISAKNPIYHPGGDPDSIFLFCTWTQFDTADNSLVGWTNGDIYAAVSNDGGATWSARVNLTNTKTPDCAPGECLSEHWSSLAENMYDGDLHIQYVCDRDAGGIVQETNTAWTDNPLMYLHITQFPVTFAPQIRTELLDPPSWTHPPIKVLPDSSRTIGMQVKNTGNSTLTYEVFTYNPYVVVVSGGSGTVLAGESACVELSIDCQEESFITDTVIVASDDTTNPHIVHQLHAVCSDDYYECDRDSATFIEKDNETLKLWACVNTSQEVWDKRIADEERQKVIFSGGVIVATTADDDTVVGRQDYRDVFTGARDTINVVEGYDYYEPECNIQMIHVKDTYIWTPYLLPPNDFKWWWIDIHKQIILFHDNPPSECPEWKKEQVIKYIWIEYSDVPGWWTDQSPFTNYEDIYVGVFVDIDAPWDEGCNGCNVAGYDYDRQMMWQHGWYNDTLPGGHPEYEDHYVGLALTDRNGNTKPPLGGQNVLNEEYLYRQGGWGWKEGELYQLTATTGVNIHYPDSVDDRTVVLTADMIPAGGDPGALDAEFILIEAFIPTGLADLQAHMDITREVLIVELDSLGVFSRDFPICGDANGDGILNIADVVYKVNYLFAGGPPPPWPLNRADHNGDGIVNIADLIAEINYLFVLIPIECSGFGRE